METNSCILCSIKTQALIHILILPDKIKVDIDFIDNIYKLTREKVQNIGSRPICESCEKELKIVEAFRQNCLYSDQLMTEIGANIANNHRILIDNMFIDVTLYEGIEEFYVSPINVVDKSWSEDKSLVPIEEDKNLVEVIEDYPEEVVTDAIVYEPIEEESPAAEVDMEVSVTEEIPLEPTQEVSEVPPKSPLTIKQKERVIFKCDQCKKQYFTLPSLDMHRFKCHKVPLPTHIKQRPKLDITNEKDIYYGLDLTKTCQYCFKECLDYTELKSHIETSHKELPRKYTCKACQRDFKTRETLRTHYLMIHTDERQGFQCQHCDKTFCHKRTLQSHEEIHHLGVNADRFVCDICGQKSNSRGDLNRHKLRHEKIKPHECPYQECGKRFTTNQEKVSHVKFKHTNERKFPCSSCDLKFVTSSARMSHMRVHTRDTEEHHPYKCSICFKSYAWRDNLNRHLKVHSDQKYVCKICSIVFARVDGLTKHLQRIHSNDERQHKCSQCPCTFNEGSSLKRHVTMNHSSKKS